MEKATLEEMGKRYPRLGPIVDITFKKEGIAGLQGLHTLAEGGYVKFEDEILIMAIIHSGDWGSGQNRVVKARFPCGRIWQEPMFMVDIVKDIESIRLATEHPLNVLMTGRKKRQEEASIKFIHECYGDLNHDEEKLPGFMLSLFGNLEIFCGLPQLKFTLETLGSGPDAIISTIILDGWSGQMIVDGIPSGKAYSAPEEFHELVMNKAYEYMEKITAPS